MAEYVFQLNPDWSVFKKSLYYDKKGDWDKAHDLVDRLPGKDAARIHAYLHRKEGDQWNADYWYRQAGLERFRGSLQEEWEFLWESFTG